MSSGAPKYRIAFDVTTLQPGCVLIQAALGATVPGGLFQDLFPAETWDVTLSDGMCVYEVTEEQLRIVSRKAMAAAALRKQLEEEQVNVA